MEPCQFPANYEYQIKTPCMRLIKKRSKFTKKQIFEYYRNGKVYSARNSAPFQQVVLKDFYEFLRLYCHSDPELVEGEEFIKKWHILEFGVGHGWNLPQQVKYFGQITAVDIAPIALKESASYGFKNVDLKLVGSEKLLFADNTFDLIVATEVLEHVPDLKITTVELKRITKPQGFILVSAPVYLNLRGFSKKIIETFLGEGTWEPARSHPGGYERFLTPSKIRSYFSDCQILYTRGADYGTAWSLPMIPLYPQKFAPFFEITLGKFPPLKNFAMNYFFLAQKL